MDEYLALDEEYRGYKIKIYQDIDPGSPRDWDNLGTMACFHRRYDLGDSHDFGDAHDLIEFVEQDDVVALPLFLIDHSGISMNTGGFRHCDPQGWDWGQVGFIYVEKDTLRKEYGKQRISKAVEQKAIKLLEGEVETYDKYLTGQVYGYVIEDADGEHVDSCWGFYDSPHYMLDHECKPIIDRVIEAENTQKHFPKVEVFITKEGKIRARIRESIELPSYEVTIGGESWATGKGRDFESTIRTKTELMVGTVISHYENIWGEL